MIKVTLKDGKIIEVAKGTSYAEIVKGISMKLYKEATVVRANGELCDLRDAANEDVVLEVLTFDDKDGKKAFWHTSSHVLAQAILKFIPDAKLTIGPAIDNGFYYDIDTDVLIDEAMMEKLEKEMKEIAKRGLAISRFELSKEEALAKYTDNEYKTELINELPEGETISFYEQGGEFTDLCAGPHLMTTSPIGAFKIMSVAGAYWRGKSENKMLKRVYAISFPKAKQLEEYLVLLEEAKKRDHRKLGKELRLFEFVDEGPGFPFFLPKGMTVYNTLMEYWREIHTREKYVEISTPTILSRHLWETSGHWYHYKENMYTTQIDEADFAIKPMNCPGGMLVYKMEPRSYRDLPIRMGEIGLVHRHELSGALNGLMRVRCFHQDDAHIFMTKEQIQDEIKDVVRLFDEVYKLFGLTFHVELSTRPEDSMGSDEDWEVATEGLRGALESIGLDYVVNEGDGAFYGPKIDFHLNDAIGRTWQCGTIQLDMQLPERFDLEYTGADGQKHRPVMIHRVVYGSIERFIGILIEHFAGAFPTWLAPVQAVVIPVSEAHKEYAHEVLAKLKAAGIRAECDDRNEKMGYRIRENQLQKVPYMLVVGDKEAEAGAVAPRDRKEILKGAMPTEEFISYITAEIKERRR
ncbi:MAG: threonine--tRNA ligase [Oscillospiraceae bacterium]|nr:threonine--tRNA ligase [Oscillospiraceae bacterium]